MTKKKIAITDIKVGDKVLFDNGKEKLSVTIKKINLSKGEIDVSWGRGRETWLLPSDFTNGYVFK